MRSRAFSIATALMSSGNSTPSDACSTIYRIHPHRPLPHSNSAAERKPDECSPNRARLSPRAAQGLACVDRARVDGALGYATGRLPTGGRYALQADRRGEQALAWFRRMRRARSARTVEATLFM